MTRISTTKRIRNMQILVAEFGKRDIGYFGIATLLDCSESAARNYVHILLDRGVVVANPVKQDSAGPDKWVYRESGNGFLIQQFLTSLEEAPIRSALFSKDVPMRRVIRAVDFSGSDPCAMAPAQSAGHSSVKRDPLVEALFGSRGQRSPHELRTRDQGLATKL